MTWTYDPTTLATSKLAQLRYLIGDTMTKDQQIQDEELVFAMSQRTNIYGAAADACRNLAARMSREADSTQGPSHTNYSARSRAYSMRASQFEVMGMARSAGQPYSGGISVTDYDFATADIDRIGGQFSIGMDEDFYPTGIVGPESMT